MSSAATDVETWSVDQVFEALTRLGCSNRVASELRDEKVDGARLKAMRADLFQRGVPNGVQKKIFGGASSDAEWKRIEEERRLLAERQVREQKMAALAERQKKMNLDKVMKRKPVKKPKAAEYGRLHNKDLMLTLMQYCDYETIQALRKTSRTLYHLLRDEVPLVAGGIVSFAKRKQRFADIYKSFDQLEFEGFFRVLCVSGRQGIGVSCILLRLMADFFAHDHGWHVAANYHGYPQLDDESRWQHGKICFEFVRSTVEMMFDSDMGEKETQRVCEDVRACMLVYSITSTYSLEDLAPLFPLLKSKKIPVILVGTKSDLEDKREVLYEEGLQIAAENGFAFCERSSSHPSYGDMDKIFEFLFTDYMRVDSNESTDQAQAKKCALQ
jgi:hypothetical protein